MPIFALNRYRTTETRSSPSGYRNDTPRSVYVVNSTLCRPFRTRGRGGRLLLSARGRPLTFDLLDVHVELRPGADERFPPGLGRRQAVHGRGPAHRTPVRGHRLHALVHRHHVHDDQTTFFPAVLVVHGPLLQHLLVRLVVRPFAQSAAGRCARCEWTKPRFRPTMPHDPAARPLSATIRTRLVTTTRRRHAVLSNSHSVRPVFSTTTCLTIFHVFISTILRLNFI